MDLYILMRRSALSQGVNTMTALGGVSDLYEEENNVCSRDVGCCGVQSYVSGYDEPEEEMSFVLVRLILCFVFVVGYVCYFIKTLEKRVLNFATKYDSVIVKVEKMFMEENLQDVARVHLVRPFAYVVVVGIALAIVGVAARSARDSFLETRGVTFVDSFSDFMTLGKTRRHFINPSAKDRWTLYSVGSKDPRMVAELVLKRGRGSFSPGLTMHGDATLPFEVFCDPQTFRRWFARFEHMCPAIRTAVTTNNFTSSCQIDAVRPLFHLLTDRHAAFSMGPTDFFPDLPRYIPVVALFLFPEMGVLSYLVMAFGSNSVVYVVAEELYKKYFGIFPVIFYEAFTKPEGSGLLWLLPVIFHTLVSFLPWYVAMPIHLVWNNMVSYGGYMSVDGLDVVEMTSYVYTLVAALYRRDILGGVAALGIKAKAIMSLFGTYNDVETFVASLINMLKDVPSMLPDFVKGEETKPATPMHTHSEADLDRLKQTCRYWLTVCATENWNDEKLEAELASLIQGLDKEGFDYLCQYIKDYGMLPPKATFLAEVSSEDMYNTLKKLVPGYVGNSPTFSKIVPLVAIMVGSEVITTPTLLLNILQRLKLATVIEGANLYAAVVSAVQAVWAGLNRIAISGRFSDFFEQPFELHFLTESIKYIGIKYGSVTDKESFEMLAQMKFMLESAIPHLKNFSPAAGRMWERLKTKTEGLEEYLVKFGDRTPPMLCMLMGIPGTGKTTAVEQLTNHLAVLDGVERRTGDKATLELEDKYPLATMGTPSVLRYLLANDIPEDYTSCQNSDKYPLCQVLQKIQDVAPLTFRAAAVEDKGVVVDPRYIFMTSNFRSFKTISDTDKLVRRINEGVNVWSFFVDEKGRSLKYDDVKDWSPERMNNALRFRVMQVRSKDKHLIFDDTQVVLNMSGFLSYFRAKREAVMKRAARINELFNSKTRCPCGLSHLFHVQLREGEKCFVKQLETCEPPEGFEGKVVDLPKSGKKKNKTYAKAVAAEEASESEPGEANSSPVEGDAQSQDVGEPENEGAPSDTGAPCNVDPIVTSGAAASVPGAWDLLSFAAMLFCIVSYAPEALTIMANFLWGNYYQQLERFLLTNKFSLFLEKWYVHGNVRVQKYVNYRKAHASYVKFREIVTRYAPMVAVLSGAALMAWSYSQKEKKKEMVLHRAPIFPEQVDPDSMNTGIPAPYISWTAQKVAQWGKPDTVSYRADFAMKGVDPKDAADKLSKNLLRVKFRFASKPNSSRTQNVLVINQQWLCFNDHFLRPDNLDREACTMTLVSNGLDTDFTYALKLGEVRPLVGSELVVCYNPFPGIFTSIESMLPLHHNLPAMKVRRVDSEDEFVATHVVTWGPPRFAAMEWDGQGEPGDCGLPVVGTVKGGSFLVGLFAYSLPEYGKVGASILSRTMLEAAVADVPIPAIIGVMPLGSNVVPDPLAPGSDLRNITTPKIQAIGTVGGSSSFVSKLKPSVLNEALAPRLVVPLGIPKKTKVLKNVLGKEVCMTPLSHAIKYFKLPCDVGFLEAADDAQHAMGRLGLSEAAKSFRCEGPLTTAQAIFGEQKIGLDRINFATSAGRLLKLENISNKYDFFKETGDEAMPYVMQSLVKDRVKACKDLFSRGYCILADVAFAIKDEVRPVEKLNEGKLRLFSVMDSIYNITARSLLGPVMTFLLQNRFQSKCFGGMNAGSYEWDEFAKYLDKHPNKFDGDFSSFDWSHSLPIIMYVSVYCREVSKLLGYQEEEADQVFRCVYSIYFQLCQLNGDAFFKFGGLPSGFLLTLVFNSLAAEYLLWKAFQRTTPHLVFEEHVNAGTVGDDNACSVSDEAAPTFNMLTAQKEFFKMGYISTPAKKGSDPAPFIPFDALTFVKRRFVFSEDLASYVAPLDTDSIFKALCFESVELGSSSIHRLSQVVVMAQREMFLHGRAAFTELQSTLRALKPEGHVWEWLSYEALIEEYKNKQFKTYL